MQPNTTSPMGSSPGLSQQQLESMPMDQLESLVMQRAAEVASAMGHNAGPGELPAPEAPAPMAQAPAPAPASAVDPDSAALMGLGPDVIMAATQELVEAGIMQAPADTITPEVQGALQAAADLAEPGLYDLTEPGDLQELVTRLANGAIQLAPAGTPTSPRIGGGAPAGNPGGGGPTPSGPGPGGLAPGGPGFGGPAPV